MRIVFDGTTLRPRRTGVGYYSEHLLQHLVQEAEHDEVIVVSNRAVDTTRPLPERVRVIQSTWRTPQMVWMQMLAPRQLRELQPDIAHFTNGMLPLGLSSPSVVTIHDMSLTLFPRYHPPRRIVLNRPLVDIAARRADAIITVSESAKRDIVSLYALSPDRVHVVHEAAAPAFRRVTDSAELERVRQKYGADGRVILYVGTIEPRKNLLALIDAFAQRRRSGDLSHRLVCVGPYGWLSRNVQRRIEQLRIRESVTFTGYVPFDDLPALYTLAELFVFPSVYEGFGLPVVEAMACGVPVITGPVSSLQEIAGGAVVQCTALDADSLGASIVAVAANRERREHLSECGIARAGLFSWTTAARKTLDVYRQVARRPADAFVPQRVKPPIPEIGVKPVAPALESQQPWMP